MALKIAFIGFRHGHVFAMYELLKNRDDVEIVAACEEDAETRASLAEQGIEITHERYDEMLDAVECDAIACGDYYGVRGARLIAALEAGKHVIGDKPLCAALDDLDRIAALADEKDRKVGCMLDLNDMGPFIKMAKMVRRGDVGEVFTVVFTGQHPLMFGKRPGWYFEEGKHGGTINDIGIHGVDFTRFITRAEVAEITAARAWNGKLKEVPHFQDCAALMLKMDNGAAVLADLSYLASDTMGYQQPQYWRFTVSGADGVMETACSERAIRLWRHDRDDVVKEVAAEDSAGGYFDDFLADIAGLPNAEGVTTDRVVKSSRATLKAQQAADSGNYPVSI